MGVLTVYTTTMSILTRIAGYMFLRIIPGKYASFCYWFYLAYCSGLIKIHQNIDLLDRETGNVQASSSNTVSEQAHEEETIKVKNGAVVVSQDGKAKMPSYAAVAAKKGESDSNTVVKEKGNGKGKAVTKRTTSTSSSTRKRLAKELGIPTWRSNPFHLLLGIPSPNKAFNYLSLALNSLLILACLDFQFTPKIFMDVKDTTFVRVGAVSDTSAKLVLRIPESLYPSTAIPGRKSILPHLHSKQQASSEDSIVEALGDDATAIVGSVLDSIIPHVAPQTTQPTNDNESNSAKLVYRATRSAGAWHYGGLIPASPSTDYVSSITLKNLLPSTQYEYAIIPPESNHTNNKGKFITPNVDHPQYFRTSPDLRLAQHQTHFTFAASSCIKQNFPYEFGQDHLSIKGASELADRIGPDHIDFLMFMGDFIYADVPWKTRSSEGYHKLYRQTFASKDYRRVYENIPTYHIYDDHEIVNDYAGQGNDSSPYFAMAAPAYNAYLGSGNPNSPSSGANYYTFRYGDAAFFVWDLRRYRSANEAIDDEEKTMLGETQKHVFLDWLADVNNTATFKFVVSSVPFQGCYSGPNGKYDTWGGFQTERAELLDVMQYVPNIIVLSGDRHEFSAVTVRDTIIDFCIGPLNQFSLPIRTMSQKTCPEDDRVVKYIPDGYRKFSTFEVDTRNVEAPIVSMKLWVDGKEAWKVDVLGKPVYPPVVENPVTQLGRTLAISLSELLGFGRNWF